MKGVYGRNGGNGNRRHWHRWHRKGIERYSCKRTLGPLILLSREHLAKLCVELITFPLFSLRQPFLAPPLVLQLQFQQLLLDVQHLGALQGILKLGTDGSVLFVPRLLVALHGRSWR